MRYKARSVARKDRWVFVTRVWTRVARWTWAAWVASRSRSCRCWGPGVAGLVLGLGACTASPRTAPDSRGAVALPAAPSVAPDPGRSAAPPSAASAAAATPGASGSGQMVARWARGQVSLQDLQAAIANQDLAVRRELATPEGRLAFLRELENYELLIQEAARRGYASRPSVIDAEYAGTVAVTLRDDLPSTPPRYPRRTFSTKYNVKLRWVLRRRGRNAAPPRSSSRRAGVWRASVPLRLAARCLSACMRRRSRRSTPSIWARLSPARWMWSTSHVGFQLHRATPGPLPPWPKTIRSEADLRRAMVGA